MGMHYEWGTTDEGFEIAPRDFNVSEWRSLDSDEVEDIDPDREETTNGPALIVGGAGGGACVIQSENLAGLRKFVERMIKTIDEFCTTCEGTGRASEDGNPCYVCNGSGRGTK